ncbi:MAG TPA: hypothetical protein PLJ60_06465 [Chryseolinea sp.]|nr:hypothetical protein [Chryseolinea sp.]
MKSTSNDNSKTSSAEKDSTKQKLSEKIDRLKRYLATFLSRQSEKLSSQQKKLSLLFFGILMGGISLRLIFRPFLNSESGSFTIPEGMKTTITIVPPETHEPVIAQEDLTMLMQFKSTLDSLYKFDRPTYEELLRGREGLLDSIDFLIGLYKQ